MGIESSISPPTSSNQEVVAVWREGGREAENDARACPGESVVDIGLLLEYSSRVGAGDLGYALLVAEQGYVTLIRLPGKVTGGGRDAYLVCFFSPKLAEGQVRAKAARAAQLLAL